MTSIKKSLILILVFFFVFALFLQDQFSPENISYSEKVESIPSPILDEKEMKQIDTILNQPFQYLGKGHQSYAFVSQDQQYVLKFFKFTYLKPSWWLPLSKKQELRRQTKLNRMFIGYHIAYQRDRDNTGLIFIHLSKTNDLKKTLQLPDSFGLKHIIDLDNVFFVIQQKAIVTKDVLKKLLDKGDLKTFKLRLSQLIELYVSEYKKGLLDGDHNILSNTGFLPDRAIRIDVGRLSYHKEIQEPKVYTKDLQKILSKRIDLWIQKTYPSFYSELHEDIESKLHSVLANVSSPK